MTHQRKQTVQAAELLCPRCSKKGGLTEYATVEAEWTKQSLQKDPQGAWRVVDGPISILEHDNVRVQCDCCSFRIDQGLWDLFDGSKAEHPQHQLDQEYADCEKGAAKRHRKRQQKNRARAAIQQLPSRAVGKAAKAEKNSPEMR